MRIHPSLLALGLLVCVVLACKTGNTNNGNAGNTNNSNTNNTSSANKAATPIPAHEATSELYMAKSADGAETTAFDPSDRTVYAIAKLRKPISGTKLAFTWYAVDVVGEEKNSEIKDVDYTTGARENIVKAHLTLPQDWPKGHYR